MKIRKLLLTLISVSLLTTGAFAYGNCDTAAYDVAQTTLDAALTAFKTARDATRTEDNIFGSREARETFYEAVDAFIEATSCLHKPGADLES